MYGVAAVESRDHELTISVEEGSSAIGPVAIALHDASIRVRDLTLRTPTLDDVFLEVTGNRMAEEDQAERSNAPTTAPILQEVNS